MRYLLQSRGLRALSVGVLFAVVVGLVATDHLSANTVSAGGSISILVPKTTVQSLQRVTDDNLTAVSVPRDALPALGADPATVDRRALVTGSIARTTLPAGRAIDLSDLYGRDSTGVASIDANQALYTLPLGSGSYPLPSLAPSSFVDVYALVLRTEQGTTLAPSGALVPSKALERSGVGSFLVVSKARVYSVSRSTVTLVVPRRAVSLLNLVRSLGSYSFAGVSPDAQTLDPTELSPQQILEAYHVSTQ